MSNLAITTNAVKDCRVLFVSNREDPYLREQLQKSLQTSDIDWVAITTPQSIHAACLRIQNSQYDVVLGATSFFDHSIDGHLNKACKQASIPYIRVDKGRAVTVVDKVNNQLRGRHLDNVLAANKRRTGVSTPRWSGTELWHLQAWVTEKLSWEEISKRISENIGTTRNPDSCRQTYYRFFVRKEYKLPSDYDDIRQAMEHQKRALAEAVKPAETTMESNIVSDSLKKSEEVIIECSDTAVRNVLINGPGGSALVETKKSLNEILAFLIG